MRRLMKSTWTTRLRCNSSCNSSNSSDAIGARSSSSASSSSNKNDNNTLTTSFEEILTRRQFTPMFDPFRDIDRELLEKLLKYSQMAPSSFNLQPFKMIVIRDTAAKIALSECMLGANAKRVLDAPISLVYVSDKEPIRLTRNLMACESAGGADPTYVNSLPAVLGSLFGNGGWLSTKLRTAASHLASPIIPSPVIPNDLTTWSIKNTIFAAQTFMLACTAASVSTAPMEGFDERRICHSLGIPQERYTVPVVISVGYASVEPVVIRKKKRYPLSDICYEDHFGKNMVLGDHLQQ